MSAPFCFRPFTGPVRSKRWRRLTVKEHEFTKPARAKRWRRLTVKVNTKHANMNLGEKMSCFDENVPFRGPYLGPFTRLVQEMYDKDMENFLHAHMETDDFIATTPCNTAQSQLVPEKNALSRALSSWLWQASCETKIVQVPSKIPAAFVDLMQIILQGQSECVQHRLAFLTSTQPLSSLSSEDTCIRM